MSGRLLVYNLGRIKFDTALLIQNSFARNHLDHLAGKSSVKGSNVLLLLEHDPVYTTGIRSHVYSKEEEERLVGLGAQFFRTNRGGLITFHGPGQLVAYPILNLKDFKMGIRDYICTLEKVIIDVCSEFEIEASTTSDVGIWVRDKKIAAIGVRGSRFITTHGIGLNCNTDLTWFDHVQPCGIPDKGVTSLSAELGRTITIHDAVIPFINNFTKHFPCENGWEFEKPPVF